MAATGESKFPLFGKYSVRLTLDDVNLMCKLLRGKFLKAASQITLNQEGTGQLMIFDLYLQIDGHAKFYVVNGHPRAILREETILGKVELVQFNFPDPTARAALLDYWNL